jgi:hypothetical protein
MSLKQWRGNVFRHLCCVAVLGLTALPAAAQTLVGDWNCTSRQGAASAELGITFAEDGAFTRYVTINDYFKGKELSVGMDVHGRWSISGRRLQETFTKINITEMQLDGQRALNDPLLADLRVEISSLASETPPPLKIDFTGPDGFQGTSPLGTLNCTRAVIVYD